MEDEIIAAYTTATQRLLLLDYDGVLAPIAKRPDGAAPSSKTLALLRSLSSQPGVLVVIISGRDRQTLDTWLGELPVDMAAEHGHFYKEAGIWQQGGELDMSWREDVRTAMTQLVREYAGSHVEEKQASLVWHYREVHNGADEQACELRIRAAAKGRAEVMPGKCVVDVRARGADKGAAALHWYAKHSWDFVLCIGDDVTDEAMFAALPKMAWTVRVGSDQTAAKGRLARQADVAALLQKLVQADRPKR